MKLKSFCKAKDTVNKTKQQPTDWEKIFTNPISDQANIQNIQRTQEVNPHKTNKQTNKQTTQFKNGTQT